MGALGKAGVGIIGLDSALDLLEDAKPDGNVTYRVSAETDYAVHVEMGTRSQQAQPYMRPAVNQTMRRADVHLEQADSMDEFVERLAEGIADRASDNAPVDTGRLRDSITYEKL